MSSRPTLGGFVNYLLVLSGVSCFVVGTWNFPRHHETAQLEEKRQTLRKHLVRLEEKHLAVDRRMHALTYDRHYQERLLRRLLGTRLPPERSLDEWLKEKNGSPSPRGAQVP